MLTKVNVGDIVRMGTSTTLWEVLDANHEYVFELKAVETGKRWKQPTHIHLFEIMDLADLETVKEREATNKFEALFG
jgi:hypothetical protein